MVRHIDRLIRTRKTHSVTRHTTQLTHHITPHSSPAYDAWRTHTSQLTNRNCLVCLLNTLTPNVMGCDKTRSVGTPRARTVRAANKRNHAHIATHTNTRTHTHTPSPTRYCQSHDQMCGWIASADSYHKSACESQRVCDLVLRMRIAPSRRRLLMLRCQTTCIHGRDAIDKTHMSAVRSNYDSQRPT